MPTERELALINDEHVLVGEVEHCRPRPRDVASAFRNNLVGYRPMYALSMYRLRGAHERAQLRTAG